MNEVLLALLRRQLLEIVVIMGMVILVFVAAIIFVVILFRSIGALFERLHVKKIGVGGIECAPDPRGKRR